MPPVSFPASDEAALWEALGSLADGARAARAKRNTILEALQHERINALLDSWERARATGWTCPLQDTLTVPRVGAS